MDAMCSMIRRSLPAAALLVFAPILGGCGTNLEQVLYQMLTATGRTVVDIALTDLANSVADRFDGDETPDDDGGDNGDGNGGDGGNGNGGNGDGGDTPTGAELYADNCAACHGADGASGFAPDISGMTTEELLAGLESDTHAGIMLTDEEVGLIADFLGGTDSGGGDGNGDGGDTGDGAALYADNCAACHGADGASGFAPDISGMTVGELLAGLESATHASIMLSDEEVGLIADFLGGSGGGGNGGTDLDGAALFADNCAACHGADGASGFAPNIRGFTTEELMIRPDGHVPVTLTDDEFAAVSAFLGGS